MSMAADDVRPAYYCAAEVMRHRQRAGQPIPHWLSRHFDQLDAKIRASESGHESDRAAGQLDGEKLITAREAANILGASTVLALTLVVIDYILVAPNVLGAFFFGKLTIILYWLIQIALLGGPRIAYRYFRYTRTRRAAKVAEASPILVLGRG